MTAMTTRRQVDDATDALVLSVEISHQNKIAPPTPKKNKLNQNTTLKKQASTIVASVGTFLILQ